MTKQQILKKAIQKAINGGWQSPTQDLMFSTVRQFGKSTMAGYYINGIIFNKGFARALWGSDTPSFQSNLMTDTKWQYHLQMMVIADDPIAYLAENI